MTQTLTISDTLYVRLKAIVQQRGLHTIEQLLELWQFNETEELRRRQETVRQIKVLQSQFFATYGEMADSVELIRADRER